MSDKNNIEDNDFVIEEVLEFFNTEYEDDDKDNDELDIISTNDLAEDIGQERNDRSKRAASGRGTSGRGASNRTASGRAASDRAASDRNASSRAKARKGTAKRNTPASRRNAKRKKKMSRTKKLVLIGIAVVVGLLLTISLVNVGLLKKDKDDIKTELKAAVECLKDSDTEGVKKAFDKVNDISNKMEDKLYNPFWSLMSVMPVVSDDIKSARVLVDVLQDANKDIIPKLITVAEKNPMSDLKDGSGINVKIIRSYLDFACDISPTIVEYGERLEGLKFNVLESKMNEYLEKINLVTDNIDEIEKYKELFDIIFGNGESKKYLILAQNSAEIRSCGGFPGACGTLIIENDRFKLDDFKAIREYLPAGVPDAAGVTNEEGRIFGSQYTYLSWDACYNPHFPKVAYITKVSYESKSGDEVDGVISLTPSVIQSLLKATGDSFTLEDGTFISGDNAVMVLQHDLYYKYYKTYEEWRANDSIVDELFAETASMALDSFKNNISVSSIAGMLEMFNDCFADRTIMVWVDDSDDEETIKNMGISGSVNFDYFNPEAGIFFSNSEPSKMGMFVDINYEVSEPVTNSEGRTEYTIKASFANTATEADMDVSDYVKGEVDGKIRSHIQLFAPKGGTISDVKYKDGTKVSYSNVYGLDVAYCHDTLIGPGEKMEVTYKVTVAKNAKNPLKVVTTPTIQEYR